MSEAMQNEAAQQCWDARDEADWDGVWYTEVVFKQWGCAERKLVTVGTWIPF